ncbi:maleylpyruvate isomerase family mycothiol-dependent enzyme [Rhodococcus sp. NPDC055024]
MENFHELSLPEQLSIARRGTAYFAQRLAALTDSQLSAPSILNSWSRRHLLAHVGYNAAALCRLLDWAATGDETPMYESTAQRGREIKEGATLSAAALRNLFDHTVARLDEKWRHLPDSAWNAQVRTARGRLVPVSETVWMRSREVWVHAVDLGNGGRFGDFPQVVLDSLLTDIVGTWRHNGLGCELDLAVDGSSTISVQTDSAPRTTVVGPLPAVVRWAAGRGAVGLGSVEALGTPPPWL